MAALRIVAMGLAKFLPAISGPESCIDSAVDTLDIFKKGSRKTGIFTHGELRQPLELLLNTVYWINRLGQA